MCLGCMKARLIWRVANDMFDRSKFLHYLKAIAEM